MPTVGFTVIFVVVLPCVDLPSFLAVCVRIFPEVLALDGSWRSVCFDDSALAVTGKVYELVQPRTRSTTDSRAVATLYDIQLIIRDIPEV